MNTLKYSNNRIHQANKKPYFENFSEERFYNLTGISKLDFGTIVKSTVGFGPSPRPTSTSLLIVSPSLALICVQIRILDLHFSSFPFFNNKLLKTLVFLFFSFHFCFGLAASAETRDPKLHIGAH